MLAQDWLILRSNKIEVHTEWTHVHEGLAFVFLIEGVGQFTQAGANDSIAPGDILVLGGGRPSRISSSKGGLRFLTFAVSMELLFPLFASSEISLLHDIVAGFNGMKHFRSPSPLTGKCGQLLSEASTMKGLTQRSQLLRVAAEVLSEECQRSPQHRAGFVSLEDHLRQVFQSLSADDLLSSTVEQLASRFGCSRRHLNRLFHQHLGLSVGDVRREMRLLKAVSLLREPDAKIINIAEQCGFNHSGVFSKYFRRRFALTPSEWRRASMPEQVTQRKLSNVDCNCGWLSKGLCPWTSSKPHLGWPVKRPTRTDLGPVRTFGEITPNGQIGPSSPSSNLSVQPIHDQTGLTFRVNV